MKAIHYTLHAESLVGKNKPSQVLLAIIEIITDSMGRPSPEMEMDLLTRFQVRVPTYCSNVQDKFNVSSFVCFPFAKIGIYIYIGNISHAHKPSRVHIMHTN